MVTKNKAIMTFAYFSFHSLFAINAVKIHFRTVLEIMFEQFFPADKARLIFAAKITCYDWKLVFVGMVPEFIVCHSLAAFGTLNLLG